LKRHEHKAIAMAVLMAHVSLAWFFWIVGQKRMQSAIPAPQPELVYIQKVSLQPRPVAPANRVPVAFTALSVPQLEMPRLEIPYEALDSPQVGPDSTPAAPSLTEAGPANAGDAGDPGSGVGQGLNALRRVVPKYPADSVRRGDQGRTLLLLHVDDKGRPVEVRVTRSSGYTRLDEAAVRAAWKWRFEPARKEGQTVDRWTKLDLGFNLFRYTFSRIQEEAGFEGELIRNDATDAGVPGGEEALRRFIDELAAGSLLYMSADVARQESDALRTALGQWGKVQTVHFMQVAGEPGTHTHKVRQEYTGGVGPTDVAVRWGMYEVRQERGTSVWRVAIDRAGEIWSAHAGAASWSR
jgi:periplasmic protein TonB